MSDFPTNLDYKNLGPQTVYEGRRWHVEVEFFLPDDATKQQVEEGIEWALAGGSIDSDHPLIDGDFRFVTVTSVQSTDWHRYTDWNEQDAEGRRSGRGRIEAARAAIAKATGAGA